MRKLSQDIGPMTGERPAAGKPAKPDPSCADCPAGSSTTAARSTAARRPAHAEGFLMFYFYLIVLYDFRPTPSDAGVRRGKCERGQGCEGPSLAVAGPSGPWAAEGAAEAAPSPPPRLSCCSVRRHLGKVRSQHT